MFSVSRLRDFGLPLAVLALFLFAQLAPAARDLKIEGPFPAKDGETCVVCNTPVSSQDSAYLVNGQRVAVMKAMEEQFLANPLAYVSKFQPEGMVFSAQQESTVSGVYLWLGMFALAGVVCGGFCAQMAMSKGLPTWRWFLLGFLFNVPASVAVAMRGGSAAMPGGLDKVPLTHAPVGCAKCGRTNHPAARVCLGCGSAMNPAVDGEVKA